jgi:aryl-alcohol dehydrogenase-like predicted oxidoreductase
MVMRRGGCGASLPGAAGAARKLLSTGEMSAPSIRRLGDSGLEISAVGLGCNNFGRRVDLAGTRAVVDAALEQGVSFFDTADSYGRGMSEEFLGQALAGRREQVVLATKFGADMGDGRGPRGSRGYILQAVEASLRRLRADVIDLYWYHWPDRQTPIIETLGALDELVRAGAVRAIGASNFSAEQIEEADALAREHGLTRFCAIQNEYSLLVRDAEREVLPTCERLGIGFVPYFPLASGLLTGKYRRGEAAPSGSRLAGREQIASDEQSETVEALERYASERGASLLEVAIGALLARPPVASVIAGATTPDQVRANAAAAGWTASDADLQALGSLLAGAPS